MKEFFMFMVPATLYGVVFAALVEAFKFFANLKEGEVPEWSRLKVMRGMALAGLLCSIAFWVLYVFEK
ncbi:MAG: hypothetical protein IKN82_08250 [Treponema sp.]|nr:hypothetical protein [Treponema sp.]